MTPLKKETENTSKWKNLPFSCHSKIDIAKMVILPKMTLFNTIIIKISITFLTKLEKNNPKIHMEAQKTTGSQNNPEQKQPDEGILNFKLPYKTRRTKTVSYWHKNRHRSKDWNRSPRTKPTQ